MVLKEHTRVQHVGIPSRCNVWAQGPIAFVDPVDLPSFLAICNSQLFNVFLSIQMAVGSFEVGVIQRTPVPNLSIVSREKLGKLALSCVDLKRSKDTSNDISHVFQVPALLQVEGETLTTRVVAWQQRVSETEQQLATHQREIDDIAFQLGPSADHYRARKPHE